MVVQNKKCLQAKSHKDILVGIRTEVQNTKCHQDKNQDESTHEAQR
jgi:hypothetical protein